MVFINFTFATSNLEIQRDNIHTSSLPVGLMGNVMFWQGESLWILEDVPVAGLFFEMLEKIERLEKEGKDFILVSDDITYNFYLRKRLDNLIIEPDWGYHSEEISVPLSEISSLKNEIEKAAKEAFLINCIMVPEMKDVILSDKEKKIVGLLG